MNATVGKGPLPRCTMRTRACLCASMIGLVCTCDTDFSPLPCLEAIDPLHPDCHVPLSRKTPEELEQRSVNFHRALLLRPVPAPGEHLHLPQARHEMVQVGDELVHAWG